MVYTCSRGKIHIAKVFTVWFGRRHFLQQWLSCCFCWGRFVNRWVYTHSHFQNRYLSSPKVVILLWNSITVTGRFCGSVSPLPILIGSSSVTLKFMSDISNYRTGFSMTYKAVEPDSQLGKFSRLNIIKHIFIRLASLLEFLIHHPLSII